MIIFRNMNKKIFICSIIAAAILIGVSFTSVVGYQNINNSKVEYNEVNDEIESYSSKDLVFETIIKISNNPKVKELIKNNRQNLLSLEYDYNDIILQLPKQKPKSILRNVFNNPSLSYDNINEIYEYGCEILDKLGEDKILELIASKELANKGIFEELTHIINNDKELSKSIDNLNRLNEEIISTTEFWDNPLICGILLVIMIAMLVIEYSVAIPIIIFFNILNITNEQVVEVILVIYRILMMPFDLIYIASLLLFFSLFCFEPYVPPY